MQQLSTTIHFTESVYTSERNEDFSIFINTLGPLDLIHHLPSPFSEHYKLNKLCLDISIVLDIIIAFNLLWLSPKLYFIVYIDAKPILSYRLEKENKIGNKIIESICESLPSNSSLNTIPILLVNDDCTLPDSCVYTRAACSPNGDQ